MSRKVTLGRDDDQVWRAAVEGSGLGMWDWRIPENVMHFSERCMSMLGYASSEIEDTPEGWLSRIHPDERERVEADIALFFNESKQSYASEYRLRCKSGGWKWVLVRGAILARDPDGGPVHMVGTVSDINERFSYIDALKRAEESARFSFKELTAYIEAISQHAILSVADCGGRITEINQKFCEISGYSREELIGKNHRILNSGIHPKGFFEEMWADISAGKIWRREICNRSKQGALYWVDSAIVPLLECDGSISRYISVRVDITDRKANDRQIQHLARHDALTGLPNRNLLEDRANQALVRACRRNGRFAVLFIDLDRFKDINDTEGHDAGDELLRQVAGRLTATIRMEDTVARQGGDEFIVLISDLTQTQDAVTVAEKLLFAISMPFHVHGRTFHIGASIGISVYPEDGMDIETLFKNSDIAMYHVKEGGRNQYQFFKEEMQNRVVKRQALREDLCEALAHDELRLHYQPIVRADNGEIVAAEVLLRWQHPERGLLCPSDFLSVAEESGLVVEIGNWILQSTCKQINLWRAAGIQALPRLIVNLSEKQLRQAGFVDTVKKILHEYSIASSWLGFDVTESMLGKQSCEALKNLDDLNLAGIAIYLDNFGTSYCNVAYFNQFSISAIKIDHSFVAAVTKTLKLEAMVKAMVDLAHAMGIEVIAEGVETAAQKECFARLGCDYFQGYLLQSPVPGDETVPWPTEWQ